MNYYSSLLQNEFLKKIDSYKIFIKMCRLKALNYVINLIYVYIFINKYKNISYLILKNENYCKLLYTLI